MLKMAYLIVLDSNLHGVDGMGEFFGNFVKKDEEETKIDLVCEKSDCRSKIEGWMRRCE